ncbi:class I SAM-dependent methyltransferase [Ignavibacteria bacterium CHB1]|jgi:Methylase involved in ubiquinone/menaquinone biosynthesis|nr:MAG: class I SAM-dependent methyltransferase [Chlorobiota bacterium]MBV6399204.1 hypothetical protein [Ignavibacteria bacterium]MCC6885349.1 class I SAM-dependent methyltransferase [Ignavibacteriales bacterium]MCE7953592.1 class I SAM-dependent methyltransferase [Chlorobi bacterium CHB7]MDL1887518.1 class I SAM-dependent methyltransferase [Ignavibacteria bacterium CHB1]OQY78405.1 MAG: methylase [Ignavibacteriales bacterium UTCHB1]RIK49223.1 MAG: methylase [Ignavibacteriota bacterium]
MITRLKKIYVKKQFNPGLIGIFINPFYFGRKGIYKKIKSYAKELNGKLLDFGCGSKPYRELFSVSEYIGVDIEVSGHPHDNENIDFYYDGKTLPFKDNEFDSVFSSEVFEHIFNLDEIINELYRVLKPGGKILITVPLVWDEHEAPYDFGRYTSYGLSHLLETSGFKVEKIERTTKYVESIFQLLNLYIYRVFEKCGTVPGFFATILFTIPLNIFGLLLSAILPDRPQLYLNNVILARK